MSSPEGRSKSTYFTTLHPISLVHVELLRVEHVVPSTEFSNKKRTNDSHVSPKRRPYCISDGSTILSQTISTASTLPQAGGHPAQCVPFQHRMNKLPPDCAILPTVAFFTCTAGGKVGLRQRHLVVQILTAASHDKPFSMELGVTDSGGARRRLVLSSSFRTLHCTPLHAQVQRVIVQYGRSFSHCSSNRGVA